jgi:hypothetical protein
MAESLGATMLTLSSKARNFVLDPIKAEVAILLLLPEVAVCWLFARFMFSALCINLSFDVW